MQLEYGASDLRMDSGSLGKIHDRTRWSSLRTLAASYSSFGIGFALLRKYLRIDGPILIFSIIYLALFAPLIPRNTASPQLLAAYVNDEPFLVMAFEAMLDPPYGNPGNYFDPKRPSAQHLPTHWGNLRYQNIIYYGGAMFEVAIAPYAALR